MSVYNFFVSEPKFNKNFRSTESGMWLIKYFPDFRYVGPFRRYLRSRSKVVKNRAEFWTFFSPKFCWGHAPKSYILVITPAFCHVMWKSFVRLFPLVPKL